MTGEFTIWNQRSKKQREPTSLNEWTCFEQHAMLVKCTNSSEAIELISATGLPNYFQHILVPNDIDLTSAACEPEIMTKLKRKFDLPSIGPKLALNEEKAITERVFSFLYENWSDFLNQVSGGHVMKNFVNENQLNTSKIQGSVVALEFHHKRQIVAVAHRSNAVYFYDLEERGWLSSYLYSKAMDGVSCIKWNPASSHQIAVGCNNGVHLWHINIPHSYSVNEKSELLSSEDDRSFHLSHPSLRNVSCIEFSSDGRFIICGSSSKGNLWIFSRVDPDSPVMVLKKSAKFTQEIKFSPSGLFLVALQDNKIRLIETKMWTDKVFQYDCSVLNFCWLPDSDCGFFSLEDRAEIYSLRLMKPYPSLESRLECVQLLNPSHFIVDDRKEIQVNGPISRLSLSPDGSRLIVSFEQNESVDGSEYIGVFQVQIMEKQAFTSDILMLIGYIHGPLPFTEEEWKEIRLSNAHPELMVFSKRCSFQGALSAMTWSNGRLTFFPFFFNKF